MGEVSLRMRYPALKSFISHNASSLHIRDDKNVSQCCEFDGMMLRRAVGVALVDFAQYLETTTEMFESGGGMALEASKIVKQDARCHHVHAVRSRPAGCALPQFLDRLVRLLQSKLQLLVTYFIWNHWRRAGNKFPVQRSHGNDTMANSRVGVRSLEELVLPKRRVKKTRELVCRIVLEEMKCLLLLGRIPDEPRRSGCRNPDRWAYACR